MHDEEGVVGFVTRVRDALNDPMLLPVHRLDRDTSGVILFGKGKTATASLSSLFEQRSIKKYYWAISDKKPQKKQGAVCGDMERARNGNWKLSRSQHNPAITQFFSYGLGDGCRAFLCKPHGGKTHQIRVALKSLGAPVLGDSRYGGDDADRMYLHASRLVFQLDSRSYDIECQPSVGEAFLSHAFTHVYQSIGHPDTHSWPMVRKTHA